MKRDTPHLEKPKSTGATSYMYCKIKIKNGCQKAQVSFRGVQLSLQSLGG